MLYRKRSAAAPAPLVALIFSGWYDPRWQRCHHGKLAGIERRVETKIFSLNPAGLMEIRVADDIPARHGADSQQLHDFAFLDAALHAVGWTGSKPAGSQVCDHWLLRGSARKGRERSWGLRRSGCR